MNINPLNVNKKSFVSLRSKISRQVTKIEAIEKIEENVLSWKERIIIAPEAKWKSIFDISILLLVGYSCIINIMFVSYID